MQSCPSPVEAQPPHDSRAWVVSRHSSNEGGEALAESSALRIEIAKGGSHPPSPDIIPEYSFLGALKW